MSKLIPNIMQKEKPVMMMQELFPVQSLKKNPPTHLPAQRKISGIGSVKYAFKES